MMLDAATIRELRALGREEFDGYTPSPYHQALEAFASNFLELADLVLQQAESLEGYRAVEADLTKVLCRIRDECCCRADHEQECPIPG